jgi:competence protein ComEA
VYVPAVGEAVTGDTAVSAPPAPLDLNQATVEQLDDLPGVGPATAQAIVDYRSRHGPLVSVDDLLEVRGIGPAKLDAFRDLVTVG